jgi:hypothetical protein
MLALMDPNRFINRFFCLLGKDFRSGKRWAAPANPLNGDSRYIIGNLKTTHSSFYQAEIAARDAR